MNFLRPFAGSSGISSESLFHGMIQEIIPLSDDIPLDPAKSRRKFINGEIKTYMAELLMRTPGGVKKWILDTSVPLHDEETGRIIGSQGVLYNDSHRMKILDSVIE